MTCKIVFNVLFNFNSIKVRLEPIGLLSALEMYAHFNSIKVRLEHSKSFLKFSFMLYFNSIKVRLEPDWPKSKRFL